MGFTRTSYSNRPKVGVFAALTAEANTTVTTAGTFVAISGTFSNTPLEGFSFTADPAIKLENGSGFYKVEWAASAKGDSNGIQVHIGIAKNGETLTTASPSVMCSFLKTANESQALGGVFVLELEQGDTVQLQLTADGNGDVITLTHFTTAISQFF